MFLLFLIFHLSVFFPAPFFSMHNCWVHSDREFFYSLIVFRSVSCDEACMDCTDYARRRAEAGVQWFSYWRNHPLYNPNDHP